MEFDLLGDIEPAPERPQEARAPENNGKVRPSIDDLLLLHAETTETASQQSLPPALQPLNSEATSAKAGDLQEKAADAQEFGDFLQGNSAERANAGLNGPGFNTVAKVEEKVGENKGVPGLSEATGFERNSEVKSPTDQTADEVLQWISSTDTSATGVDTGDGVGSQRTVADAWERASGLMGGSHMDAHIGEIASRLCSVIPAGIETEEAGANEMPAVAEETDAWKSLLDDDGVLSRSGETGAGRQQQGAFERRILDSVWPSGDNVWSDQVDGDLVNAYLRLADMSIDKAGDATEDS